MSEDGKAERPEQGQISPDDREAIRRRSEEIGRKLASVNSRPVAGERPKRESSQADFGAAFKFASELVVGVIVGGGLGWALDRQFGTKPWLMVVLVILGFAAGLLNVVRAAQQAQAKNEAQQRAAPSVTDDEE